jgi:hypothetical protein
MHLKRLEWNKLNMTANFSAQSRAQHDFAFRSRTNAPEIGKYTPKMDFVDKYVT